MANEEVQQSTLFHTRYRPETFDKMIGHAQAATRVKGIIAKGNWPTAMLITGSPSAGKTTLARCMATAINGKSIAEQVRSGVYKELDGGSQRTIDDMRDLIQLGRHKPQGGKKRIFVIDEAQSILTNKPAAQALLKPIEDSGSKDTIWVLCSMDPGKFQTTTEGKAIAGRCSQFVLPAHTQADLMRMAKRIVIGESMTYMKDSELLQKVVERASTMREVANQLQAINEYYEGLDKKPKKLGVESLLEALNSVEGNDDNLAATIVASALMGKFSQAQLAILDIGDAFQVINKILWASQFLLNNNVLNGKRHPKVFWANVNRLALEKLKGQKPTLGHFAGLVEMAVQLKTESMQFTVDAQGLISAKVYRFIKNVIAPDAVKKKD
jgi:replication-associated recombination protein RarA